MRALPILLLAAALSSPAPTIAASLKPWVGVSGTLGKYLMNDVNRDLEELNLELKGTDLHLWPIGSGPGCGLSAGVDFGPGFSLGAGYDRLFASSGIKEGENEFKYSLPANALRGIAEFAFPRKGPLGAHLGVAAGTVMEAGQIVGGEKSLDVRGTGPLFETYLGGTWWGRPGCGLTATAGYRYARVREVKIAGEIVRNPDDSKYAVDFSGLMLRIGLKFPLAK